MLLSAAITPLIFSDAAMMRFHAMPPLVLPTHAGMPPYATMPHVTPVTPRYMRDAFAAVAMPLSDFAARLTPSIIFAICCRQRIIRCRAAASQRVAMLPMFTRHC